MAKVLVQYRNTSPIEVDETSVTAQKARAGKGNWKLVNGEAEVAAFEEKKSESADASDAANEAKEVKSESAYEAPTAPAPAPAPATKGKGGRKKKANQ